MTEETDAPEGGAEAIVVHESLDAAPEVETPVAEASDDTTEQDTGTDETGQADETSEAPKRKPWWEKRFDELTADKHAERRAREAAEQRLQALERQINPPAQEAAPPDRWEDPEGYDRYLIEQAKKEVRSELQRDRATSTYQERVAKVREAKPDFDTVTNNPALPVTPTMANVIFESDVGPEVAYHLGTNPDEAARIAALPEYRQAAELGKLEAKLSQPAPAPAPRTPPPPPPQTVAGLSAGITKSLEDMSPAEYIAAAKAAGRI